uniref:Uncharacterized protein n=1 Tax=Streptomyces lasalocidi TaxID=324833 RepID=B6ZK74_STRLS|nr:hypothetical protein [Streptomyces lasalocidi]
MPTTSTPALRAVTVTRTSSGTSTVGMRGHGRPSRSCSSQERSSTSMSSWCDQCAPTSPSTETLRPSAGRSLTPLSVVMTTVLPESTAPSIPSARGPPEPPSPPWQATARGSTARATVRRRRRVPGFAVMHPAFPGSAPP